MLLLSKTEIDIDNLTYEKDSPMNTLVQEIMMSSCPYFTDNFKDNTYRTNTINRPHIINIYLLSLIFFITLLI